MAVAIGVGLEREGYPEKILSDSKKAVERGLADVKVVGDEKAIGKISKLCGAAIEFIATREPENTLVEMLLRGEVEAAIRGTLSANKVLRELKKAFKLEKLHRIAILETPDHTVFLLAPVGVDEGNNVEDKIELIKGGVKLLRTLGIKPIVAVLSGGRLEDYGRDAMVDEMLKQAEMLVDKVKKECGVDAYHQGILIEDAVESATLIIAPNGVIGNLVFRTLTLVGGGGAFGAPVVDVLPKVFVDVSRAMKGYLDSILLSIALVNLTVPL